MWDVLPFLDRARLTVEVVIPSCRALRRYLRGGAELAAVLFELWQVRHVGLHAELEEQLCSWVPGEGGVARPPGRPRVGGDVAMVTPGRVSLSEKLAAMTPAERAPSGIRAESAPAAARLLYLPHARVVSRAVPRLWTSSVLCLTASPSPRFNSRNTSVETMVMPPSTKKARWMP